MLRGSFQDALFQPEAEGDRAFRDSVRQQSAAGLRLFALCILALAVFMGSVAAVVSPGTGRRAWLLILGVFVVCGSMLALSRWRTTCPRTVGCVAAGLLELLLINISLQRTFVEPGADRYISAQAAIVLLVALATLPLLPVHALILGLVLVVGYVASAMAVGVPLQTLVLVSLAMQLALAVVLAHIMYTRMWAVHRAHAEQLNASRELLHAEVRRFVAQSAATTSRMAAALSHELNTPVGALKSSIDTLAVLAERRKTATGDQMVRIESLENRVRRSARDAALRLQQVVQRMQRVTNLDRADVQAIDLNALVKDVVYLLESESRLRGCEVILGLGELPEVTCRPQQISAVLSNVLGSAVENASGNVGLETRVVRGEVEISVVGSGPRFASAETQAIFEPGFAERSGRIQSANWSLFMARQVLRENGGEMRVEGDRFIMTLPAVRRHT